MHVTPTLLIATVTALIAGCVIGWLVARNLGSKKIANAESEAKRITTEATKEAEILKKEAVLEAKEKWYKQKSELEKEALEKRSEADELLKQSRERENELNRKVDLLNKKERDLKGLESDFMTRQKGIEIREQELAEKMRQQNQMLEKISGMTEAEAKKQLHGGVRQDAAGRRERGPGDRSLHCLSHRRRHDGRCGGVGGQSAE